MSPQDGRDELDAALAAGSYSQIAPPPGSPLTATQRVRHALARRRALPRDELELVLPGVHQPSPGLGPPSGMYRITDEGGRLEP